MTGLDLVPIFAPGRRELLARLAPALERAFREPVRIRTPWFDPERAYDASRGQYNSTTLLRLLLQDPTPDSGRVLGVSGVDLFIPVLTYVFGEAQLDGRAAVVSLHRLQPAVYGLPEDPARVAPRRLKEAVHELGHTYGLLHCGDSRCVMSSSTYVEEIDLKGDEFCPACRALLGPPSRGARERQAAGG
jgi:archaemetzincin